MITISSRLRNTLILVSYHRQQETRRRLWATILEMDLQPSLDAGMVPTIAPDAYDTEIPSDINDEDILDESTSSGVSHDPNRTDV